MKTKLFLLLLIFNSSFFIVNAQWEPDVRLTTGTGNSYTGIRSFAAYGSVVHLAWSDDRNGPYDIYYKHSSNDGMNWTAGMQLTNTSTDSYFPSIAVSGSNVYLVWVDNRDGNAEIYFKRSPDEGISWGQDIRLTNNTGNSEYPVISVSGSVIHIVWDDYRNGNYEIFYKHSTNGGVSWGQDTRLTNSAGYSENPCISISGTIVHVVWYDDRDGNDEIYYKRSPDDGLSWGSDTRLTNNSSSSGYPSISVSGSNVHVVWCDNRNGNEEIYYKQSTDGGLIWGSDVRLTNNSSSSGYPSISVSGSNVHAVWDDDRDGNDEIYYKHSINSGVNWSSDTRLTNESAASWEPFVIVSGSIVHVVWQDNRNVNFSIYYKRNPTGNIGIKNISSEVPSQFRLSQNYPNPFNPVTRFRFEIPKLSFINLAIYDILGRETETLVNRQLKPGVYEAEWEASKYTSGVYFYKLTAGDYTETRKIVLVK